MGMRGGNYTSGGTINEASMKSLVDTATAANMLAEEATRRVVELMQELNELRTAVAAMRDAPADCPRSWFVEQATRALED